jgi:hypothetical protein
MICPKDNEDIDLNLDKNCGSKMKTYSAILSTFE